MSSVDLETLRTLATLARLTPSDAELTHLAADLGRILEAFEALAQAPGTRPDEPPPTRTRADRPVPALDPEAFLAAAPAHEGGFFVVPRTVGGEA